MATGVDEMIVDVTAPGRIDAVASDTSFGLSSAAAPLLRARTESLAVPIHDGDVTVTRVRKTF
jgi:hypothetical protein